MIFATGSHNHQRAARKGETGLTLIEILIVLAIMGLTAGIALPNFMRAQVQSQADREMRSIRALYDFARSEAIKTHAPITLTADADSDGTVGGAEREIRVMDAGGAVLRRHTLRSRFIMENVPNSETSKVSFVYTADGSLNGAGGALYFSDRRENYFRLFVTRFMGSPRAEMWNGTLWSPRRGDWEWN